MLQIQVHEVTSNSGSEDVNRQGTEEKGLSSIKVTMLVK